MTQLDVLAAATAGLISGVFMILFEFPFWKRWGMQGVAEWQVNWVIVSKIGRSRRSPAKEPAISWIITSHLSHAVAAGVVFSLLLSLLASLRIVTASILLDAISYSVLLWLIFSVLLRKMFEAAGSTRISEGGVLVALLSHLVYGLFLGLLIPLL